MTQRKKEKPFCSGSSLARQINNYRYLSKNMRHSLGALGASQIRCHGDALGVEEHQRGEALSPEGEVDDVVDAGVFV